jgi:hypothetical protein
LRTIPDADGSIQQRKRIQIEDRLGIGLISRSRIIAA